MLVASAIIVLRLPAALSKRALRAELGQGLLEVAQTLETEFVRELTTEELREGAIQGMVDRTGDPYTVWIPPRDRDEFVKEVQGTFGAYDIIAEIHAETQEDFEKTVSLKIRQLSRVVSTMTLNVIKGE